MVKHDENKDLRLISRIAKVEGTNITINPKTFIGIRTLGRIDYLRHRGYTLIYDNSVRVYNVGSKSTNDSDKRTHDRMQKLHQMSKKVGRPSTIKNK
jgi:hypothetical protein